MHVVVLKQCIKHLKVLVMTLDHHLYVHALATPSKSVLIQRQGRKRDACAVWYRVEYILLVLVETVLIHTNIILLQYISTDGHGMYSDQRVHDGLRKAPLPVVVIRVGHCLSAFCDLLCPIIHQVEVIGYDIRVRVLQKLYKLWQKALVQPVITIHHLEILSCCARYRIVDGRSMASVLLGEHLEAVWIFLLVGMCQAGCGICGTIIHYEYLQTSEHRQIYKRVKTVLYILFNIVSRNDYG